MASFPSRRLKFGKDFKCVCVKVCVCVHANWLKEGIIMGVAYCKKVQSFQIDSQTCTRFGGKVGYEPKAS